MLLHYTTYFYLNMFKMFHTARKVLVLWV